MTILSVSQINRYVKSIFDSDQNLSQVYVTGEISNYRPHYSGHHYFTLKDQSSEISAVMFASSATRLRFNLENGLKVIIRGRISVYDVKGTYQLYCNDIQPDGIGALTIAYEQLKNKLESEGLFDNKYKKPIPQFPEKIGVITASTGAAVQDIFSILERRYPYAQIYFVPVAVQGVYASSEIVKAIELLNEDNNCDVIIMGRGGGSIEDLWAFNEEIVARAIFKSEIPIVSAVGHETDFTISDFVADLRAATPSAAAELTTPNTEDILYTIDSNIDTIKNKLLSEITQLEISIHLTRNKIQEHSPLSVTEERINHVSRLYLKLNNSMTNIINKYEYNLNRAITSLDDKSPLKILSKGYSIAKNSDNNVIKSTEDVKSNDEIKLILSDGTVDCLVK